MSAQLGSHQLLNGMYNVDKCTAVKFNAFILAGWKSVSALSDTQGNYMSTKYTMIQQRQRQDVVELALTGFEKTNATPYTHYSQT